MSATFYIVTVWLLIVGIALFVICLAGGKKNGISADYEDYTDDEIAYIDDAEEVAAHKAK